MILGVIAACLPPCMAFFTHHKHNGSSRHSFSAKSNIFQLRKSEYGKDTITKISVVSLLIPPRTAYRKGPLMVTKAARNIPLCIARIWYNQQVHARVWNVWRFYFARKLPRAEIWKKQDASER
jgi:hypothetical protein